MADPIRHGSVEEPIENPEFRVAKNQYMRWEYEHIGRVIGFHQKGKHVLVPMKLGEEVKMVDEVHVAEANGTPHVFFFDVTAQVLAKTAATPALPPKPLEPKV